jgi:hypothetical protein
MDMLSSPDGMRSITGNLLTEKVIDRLTAIARGEAPPLPDDEGEPDESAAEAVTVIDVVTEAAVEAAAETESEQEEEIEAEQVETESEQEANAEAKEAEA